MNELKRALCADSIGSPFIYSFFLFLFRLFASFFLAVIFVMHFEPFSHVHKPFVCTFILFTSFTFHKCLNLPEAKVHVVA